MHSRLLSLGSEHSAQRAEQPFLPLAFLPRMMILACMLGLILLGLPHSGVHASPLSPTASTPASEDSAAQPTGEQSRGRFERARTWMLMQQRSLHRQLSAGMERLRSAPSAAAAGWLILVSFLYGIFHAAGPGHGKAVIATYLLTHRADLRRGILLSALSALLQGVTAIALVFGFVTIAGRLTRDAVNQVSTLEQISFAMIAALGAWLAFRALRRLWTHVRHRRIAAARTGDQAPHGEIDGHACGCHASHHIDPARLESRWTQLATIVSIGARPCAGAVVVLAVAHLLELRLAGVFAVLAMSVGTGMTVAILAIIAVYARRWAERATSENHLGWQLIGHGMTLLGGIGIFLLGLTLFLTAASAPATAPLFMTR